MEEGTVGKGAVEGAVMMETSVVAGAEVPVFTEAWHCGLDQPRIEM